MDSIAGVRKFSLFILLIGLSMIGSGAAAIVAEAEPAVAPKEVMVSDYEQFQTMLKQSIEEAEEKGQKEIFIELKEDPNIVQPADMVEVDYTVVDQQGQVVYSTKEEMFARMDERYADLFGQSGKATGAETVLAGFAGLFPGIGHAVLGMHSGERKKTEVTPEKGFGAREEKKVKAYSRRRVLPKIARLTVNSYLENFKSAPETGKAVNFSTYFPSRVTGVQNGIVTLESMAADGKTYQDDFGAATVSVQEDSVLITLEPLIGAIFDAEGKRGVITKKDADHFYVDYNHPLAGTNLIFDVAVHRLQKFSEFEKIQIPWNIDNNTAMALAEQENKPVVLVLYAEWCHWSQRLLTNTFRDPRIKRFHDRFVWLKIDSDKEQVYKEIFGQENYPMIVLMNSQGDILEKIGGFQDGGTLALYLENILTGKTLAKAIVHAKQQSTASSQHCKSAD
ncbi:thioredoxin family protein [Desulfosarcina ovata]|uniref:peptidylprolyl isomerase n=1 Tax=Desulfosarcina ovata subsp. ovata TaxID=2752305 RepID=A0A5K8ALZ0_9BACT|nr:thioredoxin family protein [Desulfosarcina ovata]BBO92850.1 hypothetical protein DSCOOX_60300 [Desulfosarcina ovata subsp. ovata]